MEAVHHHVAHIKKAIDDDLYCKIRTWLAPIDQTSKLDACIRARSPSTCGWLWDHPKVIEWRTQGGIFWCHAGMGTGKTIIASHAIETLKDLPSECFLAYYYFEFTNPSTLSEEALFRSIVSQLAHTNESLSRQLYEHHQNGSLQPQLKSLHKTTHEIIATAARPVYIIIDALDEFPIPGRKYLLESLLALSPLATNGFHVMATSRDDADIHEIFSGGVSLDFAIEKEMVLHDITTFVDQQLTAKKWQSWPEQDILRMRNILIDKADGMFRMVSCQMEVLTQTETTEDMEQALATLPVSLGDTYLYILNKIPLHLQTRAHTLLSILSAAWVPVTMTELSALVAVELGDPTDPVNLPVYRKGLQYHEPQNIIGLGTSLVRRTEAHPNNMWNDEEVLQLSHASVKEYLFQGTPSWCALDYQLANETTARACLALLVHNEDPRQTSRVADTSYSRDYWRRHVHSSRSVQLLSQQEKLFETFPWIRSSIGENLSYIDKDLKRATFLISPLVFTAAASLEQLLVAMLESPYQWKLDELNDAMEAAVRMGSSPKVFTVLIEKGGDVNSTNGDDDPLLYRAVYSTQLHVVQVLVENGADVTAQGGRYGSALQMAASLGALDIVKLLVENGADVNMWGGKYGSAVQAAASQGAFDVVKYLVEKRAYLDMQGGAYGSALAASLSQGALDIAKFLVERGANVNLVVGADGSALQAALSKGALDLAKFFIESGAYLNIGGGKYGSALQAAVSQGALDVVKLLVERGADLNISGGVYGSALQAAASRGALGPVKFLAERGANLNISGGMYGTALQAAVSQGALDVVEFLVESGANVNISGGMYGSALQAAASRGVLGPVKFLVESGANVNISGGMYGSALQAAASRGALDVVKFLIERGADVTITGGKYGSALKAAVSQGALDVVTLLVEKGAE
ncbi:ankyrin repeat-containing domain protein [Flagelloscypha sp. PMI_526]|nr:ankyrin repeat-containing domain protein [Flagelloscypha sp. PMI_526]